MSDWRGTHWGRDAAYVGGVNGEDGHRVKVEIIVSHDDLSPLVCIGNTDHGCAFTASQAEDLASVILEVARRIRAAEKKCGECHVLSWDWSKLIPLTPPKAENQAAEGRANEAKNPSEKAE